jgi:phthalate 4,5-dioxygenase oxygenase subunit
MSTKEQNEFLTRTGSGTPMGELFRRYWIPALMAEELPEPDGPPVRVTLLSERLTAFRDSAGRLGLVDEFCAHRGVSLWFGRNEQGGLRCPYHGWKYDTTGQCTEVPSEPVESGYCKKIKLTSYPLVERGGMLWTYMGPAEQQPALPEFEFAMVGPSQRYVSKRLQETNFLQGLEGGIDPHHVSFLHSNALSRDPLIGNAKGARYNTPGAPTRFDVAKSDGGLVIAYSRSAESGNSYWRVMQWLLPTFTLIPPHADHPIHGHFWIPIDDEHCWVWTFDYHPMRSLTDKEVQAMKDGFGLHVKVDADTFIPLQNKGNDYLMDRAAQKAGIHYSGIEGIGMQDASLHESMGAIQDRTKEHLVSSDNIILMARQRLREAANGLCKGIAPPGLDPHCHRVRSATVMLPQEVAPLEALKDLLKVQDGVAPLTT